MDTLTGETIVCEPEIDEVWSQESERDTRPPVTSKAS